ncbi:Ctr copper transporter [Vararia minispora EC-137]|uniref:Ctr copper transporter n=1 Tax=Vararia minispora EC-137 TaxID=1314806 RepID=A0ACB8QGI2_9AGAM|nr:Ctr copper transporter [Vararia minispora EC-137]
MDHGGHGGHGDMDMGPKCTMNMLWNTQIEDTCIVFRQWHISSKFIFALSCIAIIAISIGYEWLRAYQRSVDFRVALALSRNKDRPVSGRSSPLPSDHDAEEAGLLSGRAFKAKTLIPVPVTPRALRATLYGASVFVSFFLMLVFMTYNAYLILSVVLGAAIGHYVFGGHMDVDAILSGGAASGKGMACH